MSKKEKEKKEKPLEKMTAPELREICKKIDGISGVHAMNKAELITVIKQDRGIEDDGGKKKGDMRAIKAQIAKIKDAKAVAAEEGKSRKELGILRRKISRLKKKTRRAA